MDTPPINCHITFINEEDQVCKGCRLWSLPSVGDFFSSWSVRDENGNYGDKMKKEIEGRIISMEHTVEEHGKNSCTWRMSQHVTITLERIPNYG